MIKMMKQLQKYLGKQQQKAFNFYKTKKRSHSLIDVTRIA